MSDDCARRRTPSDAPNRTRALHPPAPRTLEEAGLSHDLVTQLVLKSCTSRRADRHRNLARASASSSRSSSRRSSSSSARTSAKSSAGRAIGGPSYRYRITDAGRAARAAVPRAQPVRRRRAGAARAVRAYMDAYRQGGAAVDHAGARRKAFSHLVLSDGCSTRSGPAIAAGHSMFVYGPPGNGKTVIAQAIRNLLDGEIAIPHAIEVEGQHHPALRPGQPRAACADGSRRPARPDARRRRDARWVRCRRPMVMVGGELTLESLELAYSPTTGFYNAPVQAMANGGVLVIDDFGRQQCSPRDLLNRWIVPLESRVDFLTLQTGQKFELPFMVLVVFATNIRPAELVDEAFLRRIHYKVSPRARRSRTSSGSSRTAAASARSRLTTQQSSITCSTSYFRPATSRRAAAIRAISSTGAGPGRVPRPAARADRPSCWRPRAPATSWTTPRPRRPPSIAMSDGGSPSLVAMTAASMPAAARLGRGARRRPCGSRRRWAAPACRARSASSRARRTSSRTSARRRVALLRRQACCWRATPTARRIEALVDRREPVRAARADARVPNSRAGRSADRHRGR